MDVTSLEVRCSTESMTIDERFLWKAWPQNPDMIPFGIEAPRIKLEFVPGLLVYRWAVRRAEVKLGGDPLVATAEVTIEVRSVKGCRTLDAGSPDKTLMCLTLAAAPKLRVHLSSVEPLFRSGRAYVRGNHAMPASLHALILDSSDHVLLVHAPCAEVIRRVQAHLRTTVEDYEQSRRAEATLRLRRPCLAPKKGGAPAALASRGFFSRERASTSTSAARSRSPPLAKDGFPRCKKEAQTDRVVGKYCLLQPAALEEWAGSLGLRRKKLTTLRAGLVVEAVSEPRPCGTRMRLQVLVPGPHNLEGWIDLSCSAKDLEEGKTGPVAQPCD